MATAGVDAGTRRGGCFPVRRLGWYVPKIIRSIESPAATQKASVWFTAYPISMITRAGESFLRMLADEDLWRLFEAIGVDAVHTGPVKRAGGISGWDVTPSVDGHFDRISTRIDEAFGTEVEFRSMCEVAAAHGGTIIDDIVPGHTGGCRLSSGGDEGW